LIYAAVNQLDLSDTAMSPKAFEELFNSLEIYDLKSKEGRKIYRRGPRGLIILPEQVRNKVNVKKARIKNYLIIYK